MTRAEEAALKIFPVKKVPYYGLAIGAYSERDANSDKRALFCMGYKQAEKDLALSLEQVVKLDNIIMNMVGEGYNDGYKTRPFYEEVLKRFNEQRKNESK